MKAIIFAASCSRRIQNLADEEPECLIELHGKPFLEWQLASLREAGISDIAIVTG